MALPNFLIIGAYKSGTTSLYYYLKQHPQIFMSSVKEPNFFHHEKIKEILRNNGRQVTVIDNPRDYQDLFSGVTDEKAIGEASPFYLTSPIAAQRIKKMLPDVKLIAILRHPVEAFYSNHHMRLKNGVKVKGNFIKRFKEIELRIRSGEVTGLNYYGQLKRYYDLFDATQISVYLYEDLKRDPKWVLDDIFTFLDVDRSFSVDISERFNVGKTPAINGLNRMLIGLLGNPSEEKRFFVRKGMSLVKRWNLKNVPPLCEDRKIELVDALVEDIEKLSVLIHRDLSGWLPPHHSPQTFGTHTIVEDLLAPAGSSRRIGEERFR